MNNDNYIELMERYLNNTLDQEEVAEFHKRLESDPGFRKLFEEMDLLIDGIKYSASKTTLEEKLKKLDEMRIEEGRQAEDTDKDSIESTRTPVIFVFWQQLGRYRMAIAASLALFIAASVLLITINRQPLSERLYAEYFDPGRVPSTDRSTDASVNLTYDDAINAYRNEKYELAAGYFSQLLEKNPDNDEMQKFLGICQLELNKLDEAEINFKTLIDKKAGSEIENKWYLSLCFVRGERFEEAKNILEEIASQGVSRSEDAAKLLKDLK